MEIWSKCDICGRDIPVGELCYGLKKGNCICKDCCTGFENCTFTLAPMPTLTPPNEWVSVEERLPTDEHPVLVFVGYADTMTGFITTSSYFCFDENPHWQWDGLVRDEQRTLFWMPLPAPPGKDNNVPAKAPNEPLTIEELREMDGEPVWVERENAWGIVEIQEGKPFIFGTNFECGYSPHWNICRRPPEGKT